MILRTKRFTLLGTGLTAAAVLLTSACGGAKVNDTGGSSSSSSSSSSAPAAVTGSSSSASSAASSTPSSAGGGSGSSSAGSGGSSSSTSGSASQSFATVPVTGKCTAPVNMAMNDWVGYTADAAVVSYVLENDLGCKVNQKSVKEEVAWQGFPTGQIDVVLENWGHTDLVQKYITQNKTAVDAGQTGNIGQIGWYVDPWMVKKYPDITDWQNLNKYADLFKTSESGGKGQLLDGDPSFVTNDAALVTNLKLNYKVVYAGSEAALITAFQNGEKNQTPVIGYFYSPQWFLSEVPLVKINLPKYTDGCDAVAAKVACDYPTYHLNKIMAAKFANSGSPAAAFIKNFHWTNDDQNLVAKYITADKMTQQAAAKKWVDANQAKVNAWLGK